MRNGDPGSRAENGGAFARAFVKPLNYGKARRTLSPRALVVIELGTGSAYRRLTPEHAERLADELRAAAALAREQLDRKSA